MTIEVKGTLILDFVRIVRANKDRDWKKWLSPEDLEIANGRIFPAAWYPYRSFVNIAFAVFKEIGGGDPDVAREFGKFSISGLLSVYKGSLVGNSPVETLENLSRKDINFVRGGYTVNITARGEKSAKVTLGEIPLDESPEKIMVFMQYFSGVISELAERSGKHHVTTDIEPGTGEFSILVKWE